MDLGQVFTNKTVAQYMVSLLSVNKTGKFLDPCFGTGVFIDFAISQGFSNITGYELDEQLYKSVESKYPNIYLNNEDFLKASTAEKYDAIVMNPPYIRHEKINDLKSFGISKKSLRKEPIYHKLSATSNMYMYFILKAIELLSDKGELVVIFPCSWIKTASGKAFKSLLSEKCILLKQISVSGEVFEKDALVEVVILHLKKIECNINTQYKHIHITNNKLSECTTNDSDVSIDFKYSFEKIATVRRGLSTGCNDFFINPSIKNEQDTLKIISSPKAITGYNTENAFLDSVLAIKKDADLTAETRDYVNCWRKRILAKKHPKTLYLKIKHGNKNWYCLNCVDSKGILFSYFVRNEMKFIYHHSEHLIRDNFYIIKPKIDDLILFALLNNYYTYFQLERNGKKYGAGLLKLQKYDIENLLFPDVQTFSTEDVDKLKKLSKLLLSSSDDSLIDEITMIISKYSNINKPIIKKMYLELKSYRLELL